MELENEIRRKDIECMDWLARQLPATRKFRKIQKTLSKFLDEDHQAALERLTSSP